MVLQNIETDTSVRVDVRVVDSGNKINFWWFEWVIGWEMNVQEKHSAGVWTIILKGEEMLWKKLIILVLYWSHDSSLPVELIFLISWTSRAVCRGVLSEVDKFLKSALAMV